MKITQEKKDSGLGHFSLQNHKSDDLLSTDLSKNVNFSTLNNQELVKTTELSKNEAEEFSDVKSTDDSKCVLENEKNINDDSNASENNFQDTDSDLETYPLQHYQCDDPVSMQSIKNFNSSNSNSPIKVSVRKIASEINKTEESLSNTVKASDLSSDEDNIPTSPVLYDKFPRTRLKLFGLLTKKNILKQKDELNDIEMIE